MNPDAPVMAETEATTEARMTLEDAWQRFADLDRNADIVRDRFRAQRKWILALGVTATLLALVYEQLVNVQVIPFPGFDPNVFTFNKFFRWIVVLMPLIVSSLIFWSNKFSRGTNWILLRSNAESVKHHIFLFRAKAGPYTDEASLLDEPREVKLARNIKGVFERLMKTDVNSSSLKVYEGTLPPYGAKGDDGFTFLDAETYINYRLEEQMNWYKGSTGTLDQRIRRLNFWILAFGIFGSLLAAFEYEVWIAITTAIVAAFTTYLEYNQLESTLTSYNQAAADLQSIRTWWRALPDVQKHDTANFLRLVDNTEKVMQAESNRWVQEMKDALSELYEEDQETITRLKEMAASVPKDITPEELAAAFGLEPGEYEIVEDELPTEIVEEATIDNSVNLAYTSPGDFYQTTSRDEDNEATIEDLGLETAGLSPSSMVTDHDDDSPSAVDEFFGDFSAEDNIGQEDLDGLNGILNDVPGDEN